MVCKILLIVGGLNWGLVGVGMFADSDLNVVHMLLGSWGTVEAIVYVLVGLAALMKIFGCKCKKCMSCSCGSCTPDNKMQGGMFVRLTSSTQ